jgi:hypothetical protein
MAFSGGGRGMAPGAYVCMYTRICVYMHACSVCIRLYAVYVYTCMAFSGGGRGMAPSVCTCIYMYVCMYVYVYAYMCMYACM